jgi:hypothetical protein
MAGRVPDHELQWRSSLLPGALIGLSDPFFLRLAQTGNAVTGVLGGVRTSGGFVAVEVAGVVSPAGELLLTGLKPAASPFDRSGEVQVTRFVIRLPPTSGLSGTLEYVTRYGPMQNFETAEVSVTADIVSASRTSGFPLDLQSFQGHWQGGYIVRDCTLVGWTFCWPEQQDHIYYNLDLSLIQLGTAVSGLLTLPAAFSGAMTVTGTMSRDSLTLDGSVIQQSSGSTNISRLAGWATNRDGLGHMSGSFRYIKEVHWTAGRNAGEVWSTTIDAQIVSVVLAP